MIESFPNSTVGFVALLDWLRAFGSIGRVGIEGTRAALSGRASGIAKTADGSVEAIRALLIAQRSGREAHITDVRQRAPREPRRAIWRSAR